jgi:hypothetical protein
LLQEHYKFFPSVLVSLLLKTAREIQNILHFISSQKADFFLSAASDVFYFISGNTFVLFLRSCLSSSATEQG